MQQDILIQISNRIKERRKEKGITVQELAERAEVSKGLISQIENNRTIPSLLVLIDIIKALDTDLNLFFKDIRTKNGESPILVKRKEEYDFFEKEHAHGFLYYRIFTKTFKSATIDIVLLELAPHASRPMVQTEAFEYKFILSGKVEYQFSDQKVILTEGDSLLFDGLIPHTPKNIGANKARMLVMYFFEENKNV